MNHDREIRERAQGAAVLPYAKLLSFDWQLLCDSDKKLVRDIVGINFVASLNGLVHDLQRAGVE